MQIKEVHAREILDSRGNPTVEVDLLVDNFIARASVPSGASVGKYEVVELRDGKKRFLGLGVKNAVSNVNQFIRPRLKGVDCSKQQEIDTMLGHLDGTKKKSDLGANALLGVSMAACRAGAHASKKALFRHIQDLNETRSVRMPKLFFNVINGGKHAGNDLAIQECMIVPQVKKVSDSVRIASEVYHTLGKLVKNRYGGQATAVGDEGGFAPPVKRVEDALQLIVAAIEDAGYKNKVKLGLDCAASTFYKHDYYHLSKDEMLDDDELVEFYRELVKKFPIISIEDPFHQDDFEHFSVLTRKLRGVQIVGDDLTVSNKRRVTLAVRMKAANCLLLKLNQIGTVSEALEAGRLAKKHGWRIMVSHRSGETTDDFISDLAVGIGADFLKAGAPARGERVAKYNQLLRIEEMLR